VLRQQLLAIGKEKLQQVLDASKALCKRVYEKKVLPPNFKKDVNFKQGYDKYITEKRKQDPSFAFTEKHVCFQITLST
jgi:hypothetical protein